MDGVRFDLVARLLARTGTRRAFAAAVAAIAAVGTVDSHAARRNHCLRHGRRCGEHSGQKGRRCARCCSGFAYHTSDALIPTGRRRCACRNDGMPCSKDTLCCHGVCDAETGVCDDGRPASVPIECVVSVNFCHQGVIPPNCGSTTKCWCVNTNSQENFCTNGQFICASNFGNNITCNDDNDCFINYGESTACVSMSDCGSSVPCSGGTVCAQICPL